MYKKDNKLVNKIKKNNQIDLIQKFSTDDLPYIHLVLLDHLYSVFQCWYCWFAADGKKH